LDLVFDPEGDTVTADRSDSLIATIVGLTREQTLEAAIAFGDSFESDQEDAGALPAAVTDFATELETNPHGTVDDAEEIARAALIVAALEPANHDQLAEVLERVGGKLFIFGGAEIIAAGLIATKIIHIVATRGRKSTEETTEILADQDGSSRIVHKTKTVFEPSEKVGGVIASLLKGAGGGT
jgi:hypothetical protein